MAKDSNTILLFTEHRDAISYLTDEEAGLMFKAIYDYACEGVVPKFASPMMSVFAMIRSQIDRSRDAYKEKCLKNSANARKRYASKQQETCERMPSHTEASLLNPTPNPNPIPNPDIDDGADTLIINEAEMAANEECPFDKIWEMYGKPIGDVEQLRQRWQQLSFDEKKKIFEYVPKYVMARPDSKYRKDFANFLTCRTWETEPLTSNILHNGSYNQHSTSSNGTRRAVALQNTEQLVSQLLASSNEPAVSFGEGER